MSKLRNFFGGKPAAAVDDAKTDVALDDELYLTIARHYATESESVRTLLLDAEQKMNELETIKRAIAEKVDPVSKTLRLLEDTKANLGSAEQTIATLEGEGAQLRETLAATQQKLAGLENAHAGQGREFTKAQAEIADLKGRVSQQSAEIKTARDEIRRLTDHLAATERHKAQLERDLSATAQKLETTAQKLAATQGEKAAAEQSLVTASAERSQAMQRLLETEKALADAKQQHEGDVALHEANYEALKTRAELTHKLLEETRKGMLERAQAIQQSTHAA